MPTHVDQAVCIRHWDWSETSQTVSVFGRGLGVVRALAKGSRRPDGKFSGGVELLTRGEAVLILKPTAGAMAALTAWDLQETFPGLRRRLSAFYAGMYLADLAHHFVSERDPHPALFDALLLALRRLNEAGTQREESRAILLLQWATLRETGFAPTLDRDVATGNAVDQGAGYLGFSPRLGGLTRDPEGRAAAGPVPASRPVWRVRAATVGALRWAAAWSQNGTNIPGDGPGDGPGEGPGEGLSDGSITGANRLLAAYIREVLGHSLSSASSLFGTPGSVG